MNEAKANPSLRTVPTLADWQSEPWCLDARRAFEHLYGKTTDEAVRLFEENALYYQEDVMFMPSRVFGYYLRAYMKYLEASDSDFDALCFFGLIEHKLQYQPSDVQPVWSEIRHLLDHLSTDESIYALDPKICGRFPRRVARIVAQAANVFPESNAHEPTPGSA